MNIFSLTPASYGYSIALKYIYPLDTPPLPLTHLSPPSVSC